MRSESLHYLRRQAQRSASFALLCCLVGGSPGLLANDEDRPDVRTSTNVNEKHETTSEDIDGSDETKQEMKSTEAKIKESETEYVKEGVAKAEDVMNTREGTDAASSSEERLLGRDSEAELEELTVP